MEKVVEHIRKERCKGCLFLRSLAEDKCGGNIGRCREQIRWAITYTLGAVRARELDEELEVVGHGFLERTVTEDRVWWAKGMDALERYTRVDFIALPTLPGTKEKT